MTVAPAKDPAEVAIEMARPWLLQAACAGQSGLLTDPKREQEAKDLCILRCAAKVDCYRWVFALNDNDDPGGVVAGWSERKRLSEKARRRVRAARRRKKEAAEREAAEREAAAFAARVEEEARRIEEERRLASLSMPELLTEVIAALAGLFDEDATVTPLHEAATSGEECTEVAA